MRFLLPMIAAASLAACGRTSDEPAQGKVAKPDHVAAAGAAPMDGSADFAPLQSAQVKDAIHRAVVTGTDQRWQDGPWSGYAVPSRETLANGCRTIRYTIDQRPDMAATTINACDASKP